MSPYYLNILSVVTTSLSVYPLCGRSGDGTSQLNDSRSALYGENQGLSRMKLMSRVSVLYTRNVNELDDSIEKE